MTIIHKTFTVSPNPGYEMQTDDVPTGKTWRFIGMTMTFKTSNKSGNRTGNWVIQDPNDTPTLRIPLAIVIPPNLTVDFSVWIGANSIYSTASAPDPKVFWASLPDVALPAGWNLKTYTLNLDDSHTNGDCYMDAQAIIDEVVVS